VGSTVEVVGSTVGVVGSTVEVVGSTVEVIGRTVEVIGCTEVGAADGFVDATGAISPNGVWCGGVGSGLRPTKDTGVLD
jgi:hypothetical protein